MDLIYKNLPSKTAKSYLVTIGVFDGVHLGHQYILKRLKAASKTRSKPALAITFDFPPEKALHPDKRFTGYMTDYKQKASLFESLGIECVWVLQVNKDLLKITAEQFLAYINRYFLIDSMVVGSDFRFGLEAKAGPERLKEISCKYGFNLEIIAKKKFEGVLVSSSLLKKLIKTAKFNQVKKFLGRDYRIKGKVKKGKGLGKRLGYPTLNLDTFNYVLPSKGVYAAYTRVGVEDFLSAVNVGRRGFESHLINFSKDILGRVVEVVFLEKLRPELDFQSQNKLAQQLQKDIQSITSKYSVPAE